MRRVSLGMAAVVAVASLAGCGDRGDKAMASVRDGLGEVRKGVLDLELTAGAGDDEPGVGFALKGPFDLSGKPGTLPVADLTFTMLTGKGAAARSATFSSDGTTAKVTAGGTTQELTEEELRPLRLTKSSSGVAGLHVEEWAVGESRTTGSGGSTVESDVDAVRVLNEVFALAGQFGESVEPIEGEAAERLRRAVQSARMTAVVGEDDLLRELHVAIQFAAAEQARAVLGELGMARMQLDLTLTNPSR